MVAAGGAGLNINPRGRPGRAPGLVLFRLNSRNHAVDDARSLHKHDTREKYAQTLPHVKHDTRAHASRKTDWWRPDDRSAIDGRAVEIALNRTINDIVVVDVDVVNSAVHTIARALHYNVPPRPLHTGLHRFFDVLANTTDTNDPRPTAALKVRDCLWPRVESALTIGSAVESEE